jgi:UDP-glucose 4-epimerase
MMAEAFARSFELPVVTLRPFNTFGPRQSERAIIASLIRQVLDPNCKEIRVGNLSPSRAFSFVSDTVAAFLAAAEMNVKNNNYGRAFNAGTDRMVSIGTLLKIILTSAESKKPVVQEKIRFRPEDSEIMALIADSSALHAASGWSPAVTLEDGISRCIDWWRGRIDQVRPEQSYIV